MKYVSDRSRIRTEMIKVRVTAKTKGDFQAFCAAKGISMSDYINQVIEEAAVMGKLKLLLSYCEYGVFLTVNEHRNYYQTVEQSMDEWMTGEWPSEIMPDVMARMIETDTIIRLQFYPITPISSYEIWHYDLNMALDEAIYVIEGATRKESE